MIFAMRYRGQGMALGNAVVGSEILPVRRASADDRFRVMQGLRTTAMLLVVACVLLASATLGPRARDLLPLVGCLALATFAAQCLVLARPSWVVPLLRSMLVVDALWLTTCATLTGAALSPLHYAILLHVAAVTLLASFRTGLGLALLDTALLLGARDGAAWGWWPDTSPSLAAHDQQLAVLLVMIGLVAGSTATLSVLNERELRRRRRDLEALAQLTERVERAASPSSVAATMLEALVSSYGLRRGVVLASQDGRLPPLAGHGIADARAEDVGRSAVVEQAQLGKGALLVRRLDPVDDAWLFGLLPGATTLLVLPLKADTRAIGALVVEAEGSARHHRRIARALERSAAYGALALRNAWLMESVQRLAATDGLTKIANRRSFEVALERELARAVRDAEYVSLVMVDIDHFKVLNDEFGHPAGDEVLRNVAAALACACREFDTAARYGGEEFAVILPGCPAEEAMLIAERLRQSISISSSGATSPTSSAVITASAGVATFPAHAADAEGLVRAADEALYASKRGGRDRTTLAIGLPPEEQMNALVRRAVRARFRDAKAAQGDEALFPSRDS